MVRNGKERENLDFSSVAATLEKAITYVFAESPIRNAEARSSTLLCSTKILPFANIFLFHFRDAFSNAVIALRALRC